MTDRDIEYFYTVAKYLNFTEAAKHLYISQPALSKQIAKLEEALGFPLFMRSKRGIKLSPAGIVMLNGFDSLRKDYYAILDKAKLANEGKTGELRIGIQEGQNMDERILNQIRDFRLQYPQVSLEIECYPYRELLNQLSKSHIDIALCLYFSTEDFADFRVQEISQMSSYVVISREHPLSKSLEDLSVLNKLPLITVGTDLVPLGKQFVLDQCAKCNIFPSKTMFAPSYSALYLHLSMGDGFTLMNQNVWFFNKSLLFFQLPKSVDVTRISCSLEDNRNPAVPLFLSAFK